MANDHNYWRSLRELYDGESVGELKAHEFMQGVTDGFDPADLPPVSRKRFLALLGASAAFAAAGCTNYRDKGAIVPYTRKPEEVTPGVPNHYASTCTGCAQACGVLVKTREGRPIKVDGNPDHPVNRGKVCAKGQAGILDLYDPLRLRAPQYGTASGLFGDVAWKSVDEEAAKRLKDASSRGLEIAIVTGAVTSPTTAKLLAQFASAYPGTRVYSWDLLADRNRRAAWKRCYGGAEVPSVDWSAAKVILALESDFLGTDGMVLEQIRQFTAGRDVEGRDEMNRLYVAEGGFSLTGANADRRFRLRPDAQLEFVLALAGAAGVAGLPAGPDLASFAAKHGLAADALESLAKDLASHPGQAVVHAGPMLSEDVHAAVIALNEAIGAGALYRAPAVTPLEPSDPAEIAALVMRMKEGKVGAVIHLGSNPAATLPKSLGYEEALKAVPFSAAVVTSLDETARRCMLALPGNHALESWGDHTVRRGVVSLQQPVIAPLYDSRQAEAVLLAWMDPSKPYSEDLYHAYLMRRWETEVHPTSGTRSDFRTFWYASLHDGVFAAPSAAAGSPPYAPPEIPAAPASAEGFTVALVEGFYTADGRFASNGWLQELPHPVSKVVWDNYAALAPATARSIGVSNNDLVEVATASGSVTLPVVLQPGQAENVLTVALGYGRTEAGPVGTGVGVDVTPILPADCSRLIGGVRVTKAAGRYDVVSTQEHHALDDEFTKELHLRRKIVREGTLGEYRKDPHFLHKGKHELFDIAPTVTYQGLKWAMAIDLNKCVGCNACVAGCNVENNIPVVGKDQVANGREMAWIRIDRYYAGSDAEPLVSHQPMLCQHCDNAPCENVCPVAATNHSPDGLNQMAYNRCVGTKYCSNNCPYKVRRFNFFNWRDHAADGHYDREPASLVHNPEVTVRSRGVMEKCTFCVQRIMEARQHAAEQGRELKGSDVRTACQEACPAEAIVFGDMNDPSSAVARMRKHDLGYHVLEELNVRPNVTYVARLRNTGGGTEA
jgi:molybdopterin-containing oxidoreductase family iron-sulfur binding subunit